MLLVENASFGYILDKLVNNADFIARLPYWNDDEYICVDMFNGEYVLLRGNNIQQSLYYPTQSEMLLSGWDLIYIEGENDREEDFWVD